MASRADLTRKPFQEKNLHLAIFDIVHAIKRVRILHRLVAKDKRFLHADFIGAAKS